MKKEILIYIWLFLNLSEIKLSDDISKGRLIDRLANLVVMQIFTLVMIRKLCTREQSELCCFLLLYESLYYFFEQRYVKELF